MPTVTETRLESEPQVAGTHQENRVWGYEHAPGCTQAAETTTARLQGHMQRAITRVEAEGLTAAQQRALIKNPGLEAAYRGDRIDTLFKDAVRLDPKLQHLEITPRYKFGPDVFDPATQKWWDITTPAQWQPHVEKYWLFGEGTPLLTR